jgi:hypothetical protein
VKVNGSVEPFELRNWHSLEILYCLTLVKDITFRRLNLLLSSGKSLESTLLTFSATTSYCNQSNGLKLFYNCR